MQGGVQGSNVKSVKRGKRMSKTEKLLKVLDLPEEEQERWVFENVSSYQNLCGEKSLADLAFRLRDKVISSENGTRKWVCGMFDVYMKMTGSKLLNWKWGYVEAKPIHWIVAALIAKEKA
ncbi:hypothetical protein LCGC14_0421200 [marine sediment metagenome]|uniref:Uncharacterized protein n=1 Tax=marine sediment metagenome TaxID=412755 RepID=A0A0F9W029_9ZZZZ